MAEHREKVDRRLSLEVVKRVLIPLCLDLGARYIRHPYLGNYNDEDKTIKWGIGHKKHGDKRHRTQRHLHRHRLPRRRENRRRDAQHRG